MTHPSLTQGLNHASIRNINDSNMIITNDSELAVGKFLLYKLNETLQDVKVIHFKPIM